MAIIAMKGGPMRSVNIAELKNRLSAYVTFARGGEELDRLLTPGNASVTLQTLPRAARAIGRELRIELV